MRSSPPARRSATSTLGDGQRVQVEFVSANPTGPLTAGNGRGAAIGSVLASVLEAAGYDVEREYLVNDAGTQTEVFGRTLVARYLQLFGKDVEIPADGYPGEYMIDLAQQIARRVRRPLRSTRRVGRAAAGAGAARHRPDRRAHRGRPRRAWACEYDVWFRERWVYERRERDGPRTTRRCSMLRDKGYLVEKEGALWFASSELGEDKDNVVIRSTGRPTYFASDIAYHYDKFVRREFDRVIDVWGADHQGHVSRMKAAVAGARRRSVAAGHPHLPARQLPPRRGVGAAVEARRQHRADPRRRR